MSNIKRNFEQIVKGKSVQRNINSKDEQYKLFIKCWFGAPHGVFLFSGSRTN